MPTLQGLAKCGSSPIWQVTANFGVSSKLCQGWQSYKLFTGYAGCVPEESHRLPFGRNTGLFRDILTAAQLLQVQR
jgi:hypothetical protein